MSDKPFKETTKLEKYAAPVFVGVILIIFTLFAFIIKQDCDIDKVYLWCRVHPMSFFDVIGLIGFYGGAIVISGATPLKMFNTANSARWNLIWFVEMALSIAIIWNL